MPFLHFGPEPGRGGWVKKHPPLDNDKNQTKLVLWQLFSIHLQMVHVLQCVHLHYLCLEITTHPNVCINISNQGPLPLVRDEKGEHPWEKRERGALHSKQMSMLKDNIEDSHIDVMVQVPQGILQVIALATKDYRRSQKLHHISH